jgi:hypothetical protein
MEKSDISTEERKKQTKNSKFLKAKKKIIKKNIHKKKNKKEKLKKIKKKKINLLTTK